jgi:hypothetical protein
LLLQPLGELCKAMGLQIHRYFACKHGNLLDCRAKGQLQVTKISLDYLYGSLRYLTILSNLT